MRPRTCASALVSAKSTTRLKIGVVVIAMPNFASVRMPSPRSRSSAACSLISARRCAGEARAPSAH